MAKNTKAERGEIDLLPSLRFLSFTETSSAQTIRHQRRSPLKFMTRVRILQRSATSSITCNSELRNGFLGDLLEVAATTTITPTCPMRYLPQEASDVCRLIVSTISSKRTEALQQTQKCVEGKGVRILPVGKISRDAMQVLHRFRTGQVDAEGAAFAGGTFYLDVPVMFLENAPGDSKAKAAAT
jgi:hypothetical protein